MAKITKILTDRGILTMKINPINSTNQYRQNDVSFNGGLPRKIVCFGPPASGKGTQTSRLSNELGLPHIDMGSLLRAAISSGSEEGQLAKSFIEKGQLVPTKLIARIIENTLASAKCKDGYILDGFPRNLEQASLLDKINQRIEAGKKAIFQAINFEVSPKLLLERIVNRRSCPECGEIYNLKFKVPKSENECDICHVHLKQRADDTAEIAQARFRTYDEQTAPLIDYYRQQGTLSSIDANGSIEEVWHNLTKAIKR